VILDGSGFSKGYGFVKFGLEDEQKNALYEMNGYIGLGSKPLKICSAVPKPKGANGEPIFPPTASATSVVNSVYGAVCTITINDQFYIL
jgi:RNA recognition motif-containing protein